MSPFTTRHQQSHIMKLSTKLPIVSQAKVSLFPESVFFFRSSHLDNTFPLFFQPAVAHIFRLCNFGGTASPSRSQKSSHFSTISQHTLTHVSSLTMKLKKNLNSSSSFPGVPFLLSTSFSSWSDFIFTNLPFFTSLTSILNRDNTCRGRVRSKRGGPLIHFPLWVQPSEARSRAVLFYLLILNYVRV